MRKILIIASLAIAALFVFSCKEEEEDKEYMNGTLNVVHSIPEFVVSGSSYTLSVSGVVAPDGTAVGYYFTAPVTGKKDTVTTYTFTVPDTLGTFSVVASAYAIESSDKYYNSVKSIPFTIVKEGKTLGNLPPHTTSASLRGRVYGTVNIGGLEWTCSNLSYIERNSAGEEIFGHSYRNSSAVQNIIGAYYTWEEAMQVCPDGWRLPSEQDWLALMAAAGAPSDMEEFSNAPCGAGALMVRGTFNGEELWQYFRDVTITNALGFDALPFGYAQRGEGNYSFKGFGSYAAFWTSSEKDGQAVYRYINQAYDNIYAGLGNKNDFAAPVRCVRDAND